MKRTVLLFISFISCLVGFSQYDATNSIMRQAFVIYDADARGFYSLRENVMLEKVNNITRVYAYDKKAQNLYVLTPTSNVVITLTKEYAKIIKKNRNIPQLKAEEIDVLVLKYNDSLSDKFKRLNFQRQQYLDSIRAKEVSDSIARVRADSIAKVKRDSIERVRQEEARQAELAKQKAADTYRATHDWRLLPIGRHYLDCDFCDEKVRDRDSIFITAIYNDSIVYLTIEDEYLNESHLVMHKTKIFDSLKEKDCFKYHCEVFADSLNVHYEYDEDFITYANTTWFMECVERIKHKAPYGFFIDWNWSSEYSMVSMDFKYMNTNAKTIKYIDVYWRITNDVNDVRKTGHFKGTGPLKQYESASWKWDHSSYFVPGDATQMDITKVILTFMDGTQKVLTGKAIKFD